MSIAHNRICSVQVDHDYDQFSPVLVAEQAIAISDLLEDNRFEVIGQERGPYRLRVSTRNSRLTLHIATSGEELVGSHTLSFTPLRRVISDYVAIYESHARAAAAGDHYRTEAIDMGRRSIHNEGSDLLRERLSKWIDTDRSTARRLFTLVAAPFLVSATL